MDLPSLLLTRFFGNDDDQGTIQVTKKTSKPNMAMFVCFLKIVNRYYRGQELLCEELDEEESENIMFPVHVTRLTAM